jgi:hypothetical protein
MADSEAVRSRRKRAHAAGDHSLCRRDCAALKLAAPPPGAAPAQDPEAEMRLLAARLAAAHHADPGNASLARELRMTLQSLMGKSADGELAEFLAGFSKA